MCKYLTTKNTKNTKKKKNSFYLFKTFVNFVRFVVNSYINTTHYSDKMQDI